MEKLARLTDVLMHTYIHTYEIKYSGFVHSIVMPSLLACTIICVIRYSLYNYIEKERDCKYTYINIYM